MNKNDISKVSGLLKRYLDRMQMAQEFTTEELEHWLLNDDTLSTDKVVYSYVVENDGKLTDFFSFYCLESTVVNNAKHDTIRAAYLFYYASEAAFEGDSEDKTTIKVRLNQLINDALILAKKVCKLPHLLGLNAKLKQRRISMSSML